jgi:hypothetical protein
VLIQNTNLKENIEQLENILMELKESDELELIIEVNQPLSLGRGWFTVIINKIIKNKG